MITPLKKRIALLVMCSILLGNLSLFHSIGYAASIGDYLPLNHFASKEQLSTTWSASGTLANPGGSNQYLYFGRYPQSSNGAGGYNTDPIKWRILENAGSKLFLMSEQILDYQQHTNTNGDGSVSVHM